MKRNGNYFFLVRFFINAGTSMNDNTRKNPAPRPKMNIPKVIIQYRLKMKEKYVRIYEINLPTDAPKISLERCFLLLDRNPARKELAAKPIV